MKLQIQIIYQHQSNKNEPPNNQFSPFSRQFCVVFPTLLIKIIQIALVFRVTLTYRITITYRTTHLASIPNRYIRPKRFCFEKLYHIYIYKNRHTHTHVDLMYILRNTCIRRFLSKSNKVYEKYIPGLIYPKGIGQLFKITLNPNSIYINFIIRVGIITQNH